MSLALALALAALCALSLFSCSSGNYALKIGDYKVSADLLRYFVMNYKSEYEAASPGMIYFDESLQAELVENTNATLRDFASYYMLFMQYKLSLTDVQKQNVEDQIASLKAAYATDAEFNAALAENYIASVDVLREIFTMQAYCDSVYDYLTDDYHGIFRYDDAAIMADVAEGHYYSDEYLSIHYDSDDDRAEKLALAESAVQRVRAGEQMSKIYVEYYNDDPSYYFDSDSYEQLDTILYYKHDVFSADEMLSYFVDIVSSLEVGEVCDPVDHNSSFVVVRRLELDVDNNFNSIIASYLSRCFFNYVEEFSADLEITYLNGYDQINYWEIY